MKKKMAIRFGFVAAVCLFGGYLTATIWDSGWYYTLRREFRIDKSENGQLFLKARNFYAVVQPVNKEFFDCKEYLEYSWSLWCHAISSTPVEVCEASKREYIAHCLAITGQDTSEINVIRFSQSGAYCDRLRQQIKGQGILSKYRFYASYVNSCLASPLESQAYIHTQLMNDKAQSNIQ